MAGKTSNSFLLSCLILLILCTENLAKLSDGEPKSEADTLDRVPEVKTTKKITLNDGAATMFAEELKQTLERYLFGICPPTFKIILGRKNATTSPTPLSCDLDTDQQDLAGRLATLALRVHSAARVDCSRLGGALANMLGELARTAANRQALINGELANEANKKRKLSKSQKAKIQAKQRTALAVKKKAAAVAATAAAKTAGAL